MVSGADALVFNFLLAIIGFSLWYILRFNIKDQHNNLDLLINHVIMGIVTIAIWMGSGYYLMTMVEAGHEDYLLFLKESLLAGSDRNIFYLIFILIYYVMLYYEDLQQKLKTEAELSNLVREAELNALKSQINPHFLFNSSIPSARSP